MRWSVPTVCLLASLLSVRAFAEQTLGQVAEQEVARRKGIQVPARVITEQDFQPAHGLPPAPSEARPTSPSSSARDAADEQGVAVTRAQYRDGVLPQIPIQAVSGGEVLLEVTVSTEGRVTGVKTIRDTPPFTEAMTTAVRGWQFRPAEDGALPTRGQVSDAKTRKAVESKVLVAGVFRPPALFPGTLGNPPRDVAAPSEEIPTPRAPTTVPSYPPNAQFDGVVLAELRVGTDGGVANARIVRSAAGFDAPTLAAVRTLTFYAAHVHGRPTASYVYVVAGFRQPMTSSAK